MELIKQSKTQSSFWEHRQSETCPLCDGTGFQLILQNGQTQARKCRCISRVRLQTLRMKSGIPTTCWKENLERVQSQSLEEIWLVDFLKDFLMERDLPVLHLWIVSAEPNAQRILYGFANDLMQLQGYSCLWINCSTFDNTPLFGFRFHKENRGTRLITREDFVFIENYRPSLLRHRQQQKLEEILWERLHWGKSTFFLGPSPKCLSKSQDLFWDKELSRVLLRKFKIIEPGKGQDHLKNSRWLF